jgi:hypothetical protein
MNQSVIDAIVNWWTEETKVSPNIKDVRRKRTGVKHFVMHAAH